MSTPISVYITAYNAATYLAEAIQSVLDQTYPHFELILINDGSTDRTLEIMRDYEARDGRIRTFDQPNQGTGPAANRALQLARHELVARLDGDDRMLPRRLETQVRYMSDNPDVTVVSCLAYYINGKGERFGQIYADLHTKQDCKRYLAANVPISFLHPGVMYRKSEILAQGGYRPIKPGQDTDLWNRLVEQGHTVVVLDEVLVEYRMHSASTVMSNMKKMYQTYSWIEENMLRRRSQREEVSFEQYLEQIKKTPRLKRLALARRWYAHTYYRSAGLMYSRKNYLGFVKNVGLAFLINPGLIVWKIKSQLRQRQLHPLHETAAN